MWLVSGGIYLLTKDPLCFIAAVMFLCAAGIIQAINKVKT